MEERVHIPLWPFAIDGHVSLPEHPRGLVLVAQGSGNRRPGPRGRLLARSLAAAGVGTAWLDLFTNAEGERDELGRLTRDDATLMAGRLVIATDWLTAHAETRDLPLAYLGVGANAAAALVAAAERPSAVAGVVAWDGRTALAEPALGGVTPPTLRLGLSEGRHERAPRQAAIARDWLVRALAGAASPTP
jgi:putative phosphoribosyl transferase